ncbi:hypothetical protein ACOSP7_028245 [Xanthoceras sorbifolium]
MGNCTGIAQLNGFYQHQIPSILQLLLMHRRCTSPSDGWEWEQQRMTWETRDHCLYLRLYECWLTHEALISQWPSSTSSYHVRYHCFVSPERYIVAIVTGSSKRARTALIKVLFHVPKVFEPWHFESPVEWLRFRDSNASGVSSLHLFAQIVDLAISHSILECFLSNSRRRQRSTAIVNLGYGVTRRECVNRGSSGSLPFSSSLAIANPVLDGIALP